MVDLAAEQHLPSAPVCAGRIDRYPVPVAAGAARRPFVVAAAVACVAWLVVWPLFSWAFLNRYDLSAPPRIADMYLRKDLALARPAVPGAGRLIVVGGSGALIGVDAQLIERKLGVRTINYATHAGLAGYILHRAASALRPGDSVLLCPEYELWRGHARNISDFEWAYVSSYDKRYLWSLGPGYALRTLYSEPASAYFEALAGWRARLSRDFPKLSGPFNPAEFDAECDLRGELPRMAFAIPEAYPMPDARDPECAVEEFRAFAQQARDVGAAVYYSWPNCCRPTGAPLGVAPPATRRLLAELGFTVLNEPSDTEFPADWFRDSPYHANAGCRRVRTEALIRRLRPYFHGAAAPVPSAPASAGPAGIYLVTAGTSWLHAQTIFADRPGVRARYLTPTPVDCPDAITPAQLESAARAGTPIWFDDDAVAKLLPAQRWSSMEIASERASLDDWIKRWPGGLFVVAAADGRAPVAGVAASASAAPPALSAALARGRVVAALFGGELGSRSSRLILGHPEAALSASATELTGRPGPVLRLAASARPGHARVGANGEPIAIAAPGEIAVEVVDPVSRIVVESGSLPRAGEKTIWSLRRLTPR